MVFGFDIGFAQYGQFRKPLTPHDYVFLKKEAAECFVFNAHLQLSYNNQDFSFDKHKQGDLPATPENADLLKKKIKKEPQNVLLYTELSGLYKRLNMPEESAEYRKKSIDLITGIIQQHPDSIDAIKTLAAIYLGALQTDSALVKYKLVLSKDPKNEDALSIIPFMHIINNRYDSAYAFFIHEIKKDPGNYNLYKALPVYYIYKFYNQLSELKKLPKIESNALEPENIISLKLLKDYYEQDVIDFKREYLFRATYQVCYSTLLTYKTVNDSSFNTKNIKFIVTAKDEKNLATSEAFFKNSLQSRELKNKTFSYKTIGNINLLLNRPKEAIPYLKKAIQLKPASTSTIGNNASEDYDNLITAYFILKDTVNYEKIIFKKIKVKPAIDPSAADYIFAAKVCISKKKYAEAEKWFNEALTINTKNSDIYLGLALTYFLNDNYKLSIATIDKAYALNSKQWELYILYGIVSLCNNDPVNAFELFKTGKKLHDAEWIREELMEKYYDIMN